MIHFRKSGMFALSAVLLGLCGPLSEPAGAADERIAQLAPHCVPNSQSATPKLGMNSCRFFLKREPGSFLQALEDNNRILVRCRYYARAKSPRMDNCPGCDVPTMCSKGTLLANAVGVPDVTCDLAWENSPGQLNPEGPGNGPNEKNHLGQPCGWSEFHSNRHTPPNISWEESHFNGVVTRAMRFHTAAVVKEIEAGALKIGDRCQGLAKTYRDVLRASIENAAQEQFACTKNLPLKIFAGGVEFCETDPEKIRAQLALVGATEDEYTRAQTALGKSTLCDMARARINAEAAFTYVAQCEIDARVELSVEDTQSALRERIGSLVDRCAVEAEDAAQTVFSPRRKARRAFNRCYRDNSGNIHEIFRDTINQFLPSSGPFLDMTKGKGPEGAQAPRKDAPVFAGLGLLPLGAAFRRRRPGSRRAAGRAAVLLALLSVIATFAAGCSDERRKHQRDTCVGMSHPTYKTVPELFTAATSTAVTAGAAVNQKSCKPTVYEVSGTAAMSRCPKVSKDDVSCPRPALLQTDANGNIVEDANPGYAIIGDIDPVRSDDPETDQNKRFCPTFKMLAEFEDPNDPELATAQEAAVSEAMAASEDAKFSVKLNACCSQSSGGLAPLPAVDDPEKKSPEDATKTLCEYCAIDGKDCTNLPGQNGNTERVEETVEEGCESIQQADLKNSCDRPLLYDTSGITADPALFNVDGGRVLNRTDVPQDPAFNQLFLDCRTGGDSEAPTPDGQVSPPEGGGGDSPPAPPAPPAGGETPGGGGGPDLGDGSGTNGQGSGNPPVGTGSAPAGGLPISTESSIVGAAGSQPNGLVASFGTQCRGDQVVCDVNGNNVTQCVAPSACNGPTAKILATPNSITRGSGQPSSNGSSSGAFAGGGAGLLKKDAGSLGGSRGGGGGGGSGLLGAGLNQAQQQGASYAGGGQGLGSGGGGGYIAGGGGYGSAGGGGGGGDLDGQTSFGGDRHLAGGVGGNAPGELPASGSQDPDDYFTRVGTTGSLFQQVARKLRDKQENWAMQDVASKRETLEKSKKDRQKASH